jgi:hypothetical protein
MTTDNQLMDNWRSLAAAIIVSAIKDYEVALNKQKKADLLVASFSEELRGTDAYLSACKKARDKADAVKKLERFFKSAWCDELLFFGTNGYCEVKNGDDLIKILQTYLTQKKYNTKRSITKGQIGGWER